MCRGVSRDGEMNEGRGRGRNVPRVYIYEKFHRDLGAAYILSVFLCMYVYTRVYPRRPRIGSPSHSSSDVKRIEFRPRFVCLVASLPFPRTFHYDALNAQFHHDGQGVRIISLTSPTRSRTLTTLRLRPYRKISMDIVVDFLQPAGGLGKDVFWTVFETVVIYKIRRPA